MRVYLGGSYEGAYVLRISRTSDVKTYTETINFLDTEKRKRLAKLMTGRK